MSIDISGIMAMRSSIIDQNRALQRAAATGQGGAEAPGGVTGFADAMRGAVNQVNALQTQATASSEGFELGTTTDIASVMLDRQRASLGFEATLQVRNKLLSAYRDIMNMPV